MSTLAVCVSDVADWAQIVGVALALFALAIAWFQLRKAVGQATSAATDAKRAVLVAETQAVLTLDLALSSPANERLRQKINSGNLTRQDGVPLRRYIAAFERLGLLLENGVVTIDVANLFYGDRLENLLVKAESDVRKIVQKKSAAGAAGPGPGREGWKTFIRLWQRMRAEAEGRGLIPEPPTLGENRKEDVPSAVELRGDGPWLMVRRG